MTNRTIRAILALTCVVLAFVIGQKWERRATIRQFSADEPGGAIRSATDVRQLLNRNLPEVHVDNQTFEQAITALSELSKANICVNWREMKNCGILRTDKASLHLKNVTLHEALRRLLADSTASRNRPGFYVDNGIVMVTSIEQENDHLVFEAINVRDIMHEFDLYEATLPHSRRAPGSLASSTEEVATPTHEELQNILLATIMLGVAPNSWLDNGGKGSIRLLADILVITQTPEHLREVHALLYDLRIAFHSSAPAYLSSGLPTTSAAGLSAADADKDAIPLLTTVINVRSLAEKLQSTKGWELLHRGSDLARSEEDIMDATMALIKDMIDRDSWTDNEPKSHGMIRAAAGLLIIRQTPRNIRSSRQLLDDLYRSTAKDDFRQTTKSTAPTN